MRRQDWLESGRVYLFPSTRKLVLEIFPLIVTKENISRHSVKCTQQVKLFGAFPKVSPLSRHSLSIANGYPKNRQYPLERLKDLQGLQDGTFLACVSTHLGTSYPFPSKKNWKKTYEKTSETIRDSSLRGMLDPTKLFLAKLTLARQSNFAKARRKKLMFS